MDLSPWFDILILMGLVAPLMSFCLIFGKAVGNLQWSWERTWAVALTLFLYGAISMGVCSLIVMEFP